MPDIKQIYLNLPVKDLNRSIDFFTKTGFTFNPQFTDENATCMIIGENIFVMLLTDKFFSTFIDKPVADSAKGAAIMALAVESRPEVDSLIEKALAAGGREYLEPRDHGWMYSRCFEDIDGHLWEAFYMDESAIPQE